MTKLNVAYFGKIGFELILVPLDDSFGNKTHAEKQEIIKNLHIDANSSGMKGTVVPIWKNGNHRSFIAPIELHPFIRGLSWDEVVLSVNCELNLRD